MELEKGTRAPRHAYLGGERRFRDIAGESGICASIKHIQQKETFNH